MRCSITVGLATALVLAGCTLTSTPTARRASVARVAAVRHENTRSVSTTGSGQDANYLSVCSFNIQWLGQSAKRDNAALADLLAPYDIVVIQELIAAPATSGSDSGARQRAADFFKEMGRRGFAFHLSGDTGPKGPLGSSTSKTEWWVTFFRPEKVEPAAGLPQGFVSMPLAKNPDYDRVPYALPLRTTDGRFDCVLLSVHLNPDKARTHRAHELKALGSWIAAESARQAEKDFIVLGDTNIQGQNELRAVIPSGMVSLNADCVGTNVSPKSPKPYAQVFFNPTYSTEIDRGYGFHVINLIEEMRRHWTSSAPYPGDPYQPNVFRYFYSDHNPVVFRIKVPEKDDD